MTTWHKSLVFAALITLLYTSVSAGPRSSSARLEFKRHNPCPATGQRNGTCPGYVIDHIHPLCARGPDRPENMQWQTRADSLVKDREERSMCLRARK